MKRSQISISGNETLIPGSPVSLDAGSPFPEDFMPRGHGQSPNQPRFVWRSGTEVKDRKGEKLQFRSFSRVQQLGRFQDRQ